jgi:hypothetical protein
VSRSGAPRLACRAGYVLAGGHDLAGAAVERDAQTPAGAALDDRAV